MLENKTSIGINGNPKKEIVLEPMGMSHDAQAMITNLMHRIVTEEGKYTLAELGYLHMNSISYSKGHAEVNLYFAPELATIVKAQLNGNGKAIPNPALNVFNGYMFIGSLDGVVEYVETNLPKYSIVTDERGLPAIKIKDGKKVQETVEAVVLHCNLELTMAAMFDCNIFDENFSVTYETIGGLKNKKDEDDNDPNIMINMGVNQEFPIRVFVTTPVNESNYNRDDAIPYLISKVQANSSAAKAQKKLAEKVSSRAEELTKKKDKKANAWQKFR